MHVGSVQEGEGAGEGGFPSCLPLEERSRPLDLDLAWIRAKASAAVFEIRNEIRNLIAW